MIDWTKTDNFAANEWPGNVIGSMDSYLFHECIFPLREATGVSMTPSPLKEGHIRAVGGSRHSLDHGDGARLSDASDLFIASDKDKVVSVLSHARQIHAVGGFGLYFDTKPSVMIHVDARPVVKRVNGIQIRWLRVDDNYIYEHKDASLYYAELANQLEKL